MACLPIDFTEKIIKIVKHEPWITYVEISILQYNNFWTVIWIQFKLTT